MVVSVSYLKSGNLLCGSRLGHWARCMAAAEQLGHPHWIDAAELACTNFCCFHGGPWADRCEYELGNGDEKTLKREIFTMNSCEFAKA